MARRDQSEGDRARDEVLAGEYVLGMLSAEARQRVEARLRHDQPFAAIVSRWEENLVPLEDDDQPASPLRLALPQVLPSLRPVRGMGTPSARGGVLAAAWRSVGLWRSLAFASTFLLAGTVLFAERSAFHAEGAAALRADLATQDTGSISLSAAYDPKTGLLRLAPVAAAADDRPQVLELWLMGDGGASTSLGLVPQKAGDSLVLAPALRQKLVKGATLAVSLEEPGGSATGEPSLPLLALGQVQGQVQGP
ncbi:anti-sigma factor [Rhizobium sp. SSA_523]|uniref:anti-sigma factor n=1 Tax=Rhizobium sp. SSA_523 TaxID=2952477 RepID=UPI002091A4F8|nr:anti-sigma factor [Rhizobium sp. SSA_523]MCO5732603.1 anti-sigma factor [Rhizobium sp. SSA_523]WKC23761.1 anti-sigma factor [Rhizobium sp. SSA_523]